MQDDDDDDVEWTYKTCINGEENAYIKSMLVLNDKYKRSCHSVNWCTM